MYGIVLLCESVRDWELLINCDKAARVKLRYHQYMPVLIVLCGVAKYMHMYVMRQSVAP